jgi:hypothetical protein
MQEALQIIDQLEESFPLGARLQEVIEALEQRAPLSGQNSEKRAVE